MITETSYRIKTIPNLDNYTIPANCCMSCIYTSAVNKSIFESLCKVIKSLENPSIIAQLTTFCNCLAECLQRKGCLTALPKMLPQIDSDEVFIEWIFDNFRMGFLFCEDSSESGWTVVLDTPEGIRSDSSGFAEDIPTSVEKITEYILRLT